VVGLGERVAPTDVEEGMRVGVDRTKYQIQIPLPPKIDPTVTMMTVEEKPDITYNDVGGCKEQIEKLREVVEMPLLHPERFVNLGIDPPKGILLYGPPGTGKTLSVCSFEYLCVCVCACVCVCWVYVGCVLSVIVVAVVACCLCTCLLFLICTL
jgi:ATP-dependent 26S proteasome regulatory subunit